MVRFNNILLLAALAALLVNTTAPALPQEEPDNPLGLDDITDEVPVVKGVKPKYRTPYKKPSVSTKTETTTATETKTQTETTTVTEPKESTVTTTESTTVTTTIKTTPTDDGYYHRKRSSYKKDRKYKH